jgi:hypothetical protein
MNSNPASPILAEADAWLPSRRNEISVLLTHHPGSQANMKTPSKKLIVARRDLCQGGKS